MTAAARLLTAGAALCALLALALWSGRGNGPAIAGATALPPPCSSCDARHAAQRATGIALPEARE